MEKTISVIIPNFNGRHLLQKNLPLVLKECNGCEIIVVDDGSSDDSVEFIKKNFKKIKLVARTKNGGFVKAINSGVEKAEGEWVLLLNSDVRPRENFLKPLLPHLQDKNLFAVGLEDFSHEGEKIVTRGRGAAEFKKGFVAHRRLSSEKGETFWVSGGSGLFNREKFTELGGLDVDYAPFYWEDIDLSYRARKAGYFCFFEPGSKVDHYHEEGAIQKTRSGFFIKTISYKNQFIFVWKNISDPLLLLQHVLWFPCHVAIAVKNQDWPFFLGFIKACLQLPIMILNYQAELPQKLTDREVLKKL